MSSWSHKRRFYRNSDEQNRWQNGHKTPIPVPTTTPPPLGKLIQTVRVKDLAGESKNFIDSAAIRDCEAIASFNWLDKKGSESTVLTPGKPPLWTPPVAPTVLKEDSGTYFRDKNAARYPKHPMEAAIVTALGVDRDLPAKLDIMACGSTLGNLLRFVCGQDKPFRMLAEKVDNTVFFIRRENSPTELIPNIRGFGHAFPEAYTTWELDVKGSASHQRILRYTLGGLKIAIRFEADGYVKAPLGEHPVVPLAKATHLSSEDSLDTLVAALSENQVSPSSVELSSIASSCAVKTKPGGSFIGQEYVFDLKTRSIKTKFVKDHLGEELPRLWVSQIPKFILAFHASGFFKPQEIEVRDIRAEVANWEKEHVDDLSRLAALVHRIIAMTSSAPGGKLELCHQTIGELHVREQLPDAGDVMSTEVRARWGKSASAIAVGMDSPAVEDRYEDHSSEEDSISEHQLDFTACSFGDCGYCGRCSY
ncbi:hypothetical protein B0T26DRAFT_655827 [Lasiosphaeria miniovina]|uniref:Geranylgeranyl pyrophosphate synthetase n=1 Tax=Lasiosphaeria miniovina TaxID=1954250 RepID=A0AA40DN20_9PEZI|nr:uncharacterized protein B0T26DRAFT_655827 [Lasiosphaeria miniovina]KAK0705858.1 hypothetical protein B0T26DRAFT_655827 [Lasiosphaeria miniovina]